MIDFLFPSFHLNSSQYKHLSPTFWELYIVLHLDQHSLSTLLWLYESYVKLSHKINYDYLSFLAYFLFSLSFLGCFVFYIFISSSTTDSLPVVAILRYWDVPRNLSISSSWRSLQDGPSSANSNTCVSSEFVSIHSFYLHDELHFPTSFKTAW